MRVRDLSRYRGPAYAALITFSAVSLSSLEFIRNAFPSPEVVHVRKTTVIFLILLVQVLPFLLLLGADRLIAARYGSGRPLRVFRSLVFVVAVVLILRQLQLYWGPANDFSDSVRSKGVFLVVLVNLAFLGALVGIAIWLFRGLAWFFVYMSPVAIAVTVLLPSQVPTLPNCGDSFPCLADVYGNEVVTASPSASQPPVFILVFDELGYDVLLQDQGGELDAESFPNIAALAADGVWFTNATANYYFTIDTLQDIIGSAKSLTEHFNVRLYSQFLLLEYRYIDACGIVITCRGAGHLIQNYQLGLASNLALRSFYQATPERVERVISRPMGWLLDRLGWAYPPVDPLGIHTFTKRQFDVYLNDINAREASGRVYLLHLMLPHFPMAFNGEGEALSTPPVPKYEPERYRQQAMYADVLLGKFVEKLKREGIYDDSVIVLTGDHGPRDVDPSPERPPPEYIPHVPLVIHAPGLNSHMSDVDYQHIDFGATLTDILGLPPPDGTEGVSAFSKERPRREKLFTSGGYVFVYSEEDGSWHFSHKE
ncbi:MAG: sulfatase-like hydrolase/transferase [Chloroflexi bacterium]|nr:sulfatase-like hydrolase/transferase [Chloroflexota bacterium]